MNRALWGGTDLAAVASGCGGLGSEMEIAARWERTSDALSVFVIVVGRDYRLVVTRACYAGVTAHPDVV